MRIYISAKYYFIASWISLVLSSIFILIALVVFADILFAGSTVSFLPLILIFFGCSQYTVIISRTIYIEDNKIIVKGVFSSATFDIQDFKEVRRDWWGAGQDHTIYFNDGNNYRFYPNSKFKNSSITIAFWDTSAVDNINDTVNRMK
jgi:hypothetical protein